MEYVGAYCFLMCSGAAGKSCCTISCCKGTGKVGWDGTIGGTGKMMERVARDIGMQIEKDGFWRKGSSPLMETHPLMEDESRKRC